MLGEHLAGALPTQAQPKADLASKLYNEGTELATKGDYPGALTKYEAGLQVAEKSGNKRAVATILLGIGVVYYRQGSYAEAAKHYQRALKICEELGDKSGMARTLNNLGIVYRNQGSYNTALEYYQKSLKLQEELGDKGVIAASLSNLGNVYRSQGSYDKAIEYYQKSLKIEEELGNKIGIAQTINNLGVAYQSQGSYDKAIEYYRKSLKVKEDLGDKNGMAQTLNNLGAAHYNQGSYGQAIACYQKSLKVKEELGDKSGMAQTLNNLGLIYSDQGSYGAALAIEYYQKSLKLREELGDKNGLAELLNNLGSVYYNQESYDKAIENYQESLKRREELGDKSGMARTLNNLGLVCDRQGSYDPAMGYFQRALKIGQEINARSIVGDVLVSMGDAYLKLQRYPQAMETLRQALAIGEEIKEPSIIWLARRHLADVYEKLGDRVQALQHYQAAIEELEKVRVGVSSDAGKAGFLQDRAYVYKKASALLLTLHESEPSQGYDKQSLAYAEKVRARALVDLLGEGLVGLNKRLSPELQEKEKSILNQLSRANQKLQRQGPGPDREALVGEIKQLETGHDQLKEEVRRQDPMYASLAYPQPYTLDQIRQNILDDETALVEYVLDDEQSFVYLVSRQELVIKRLPGRARIEEKVTTFLNAMKSPPDGRTTMDTLQALSRDLYQDLLAPLADRLGRYRHLMLAADGLLYYLPFEALGLPDKTGFRYLIEDHVISYLPSATVLGELLRRRSHRVKSETLLALGDPDFSKKEELVLSRPNATAGVRGLYDVQFGLERLPFAGEEVQEIARYFRRSVIRVGRDASEDFVKHAPLENYRILHFATHGLLDEQNPNASCLVLARAEDGPEDGFLQVREIYNLRLDADLVVLSACNTGRGRLVNGEGVVGLHRAFFYAGARSVLASLWSVNDRASSDLMSLFYYHLQKGQGKAEAMRAAKLKFLKSASHAHPYYWAGFILQGEPKEKLFPGTPWWRWPLAGGLVLVLFLVVRRVLRTRSTIRSQRSV
jgi:CHAT domain-containing protein/tetratricopeptide (TPR) repeat protein